MCIILCQNIALIVRIPKMYDMWQKRKVQTIVLTLRDSSHLQSTESWDSPYNKIGLKWQDAVLCPQLSSGLHGGEEKGVRGAEREFRELCCSSLLPAGGGGRSGARFPHSLPVFAGAALGSRTAGARTLLREKFCGSASARPVLCLVGLHSPRDLLSRTPFEE